MPFGKMGSNLLSRVKATTANAGQRKGGGSGGSGGRSGRGSRRPGNLLGGGAFKPPPPPRTKPAYEDTSLSPEEQAAAYGAADAKAQEAAQARMTANSEREQAEKAEVERQRQAQQKKEAEARAAAEAEQARRNAGLDLVDPGVAETAFGELTAGMSGPTAAETQLGSAREALGGPSLTTNLLGTVGQDLGRVGSGESYFASNRGAYTRESASEQALADLQQIDPGLGAYYDRARQRQAGAMNDQLAARGGFGSSAGIDMISEGMADLNAQQANREADYMLQQREQMLGAAGQADTQRLAGLGLGTEAAIGSQNAGLSRVGLLGDITGQAEGEGLARERALMEGAGMADTSKTGVYDSVLRGAGIAGDERLKRAGLMADVDFRDKTLNLNTILPLIAGQITGEEASLDKILGPLVGETTEGRNQALADLTREIERGNRNVNIGAGAANTAVSTAGGLLSPM